jgi:peptide/nickel transport system substrate-binding protein
MGRNRSALRRGVVFAAVLGLLLMLVGTAEAPAKAKACKKGLVRNKAGKCVKKATATTKKATATTKKATGNTSSAPSDVDRDAVVKIGFDLAAQGGLKFDPATMGAGQYIQTLPVLRTLLTRTQDLDFKPDLAESAKILNPTTLEVNLRPNMKFSDGTDLDSAAVRATFNRNLASNNANGLQIPDMQVVKQIDINSPTKFTIRLSKPNAGVVYALLAGVEFAPMSPKSFSDGTNLDRFAVGAGPMKLIDYVPNQHIDFVKNPYYWDAEHVYLKGMQYVHVPAGAAVVNGLRSGAVDWASIQPDQAQNMLGNLKATMYQMTAADTIQWCVKDGTPLGNVKVRQAVAYAINRDNYNGIIQNGVSSEAWDLFPASSKFHNKSLDNIYKRDITKAKALLTEAGFPNGFKFTLATTATTQSNAEVLQSQLRDAGIDMSILISNNTTADYYTLATQKAEATLSQSRPGPWDKVSRFYLSDSFSNACKAPSPQVDRLYAQVAGLALDDPAAVPAWQKLSEVIFKDLAFFPQVNFTIAGYGYNASEFGKLVTYVDQLGTRRVDPVGTYIKK